MLARGGDGAGEKQCSFENFRDVVSVVANQVRQNTFRLTGTLSPASTTGEAAARPHGDD